MQKLLFPIFIDLNEQPVVVIGGGPVALRKARQLARFGARTTVVAPTLCSEFEDHLDALGITHECRDFKASDLDGQTLVVAATGDVGINRQIAELARERRLPVNVVNRPNLGSFTFGSIVDRSPVVLAVSTGGQSPALARMLRARLEAFVPRRFGKLAHLMSDYRERVKSQLPDVEERLRFWRKVLNGPLSESLFRNDIDEANSILEQALETDHRHPAGEVYLVGAGPGDPDLLTFRALRLIQQADIVLYDRLVSPPILDLIPDHTERMYVGKAKSNHSMDQRDINRTLADLALAGKRVLRLKGGDPFIFGRGGEEISQLTDQGIAFQVVPGITAATGCAAYAGIPLTHREHAHACVFVTGHLKNGKLDLNWQSLVQPCQTIVVYMGLDGLESLCSELIRHGLSGTTPAALVERGTTPDHRVITATVATLADEVQKAEVHAPTLIIIGQVVTLRDRLMWYENR